MIKSLLAITLLFSFMNFAQANTIDLEIKVQANESYYIPGPAHSCADINKKMKDPTYNQDSVSEPHARYGNLIVEWKNPNRKLTVQSIELVLEDPNLYGGRYQSTLAGEEVTLILGRPFGELGLGPIRIESNPSGPRLGGYAHCALTYGSIDVEGYNKNFTAKGRVIVRGISSLPDNTDPKYEKASYDVGMRHEY